MFIINHNLKDLNDFISHPIFNFKKEIMFLALLTFLFLLCFIMTKKTSCKVYLVDFICYKPPNSQMYSKESTIKNLRQFGYYSEETLDFMTKVLERSGLGDSTYFPDTFSKQTYNPSINDTRRGVEMTIFGSVDMLLAKTGVRCKDIGILILNCTVYNPVPSLCSIIVNRYKLRESIITYNLAGMGCSAGLRAIGLAQQLLQVHPKSYALIVTTEVINDNLYLGNDRSKLLINCVFRVGGAAILLSNHPPDGKNYKYELLHTIHTNTSRLERSYNCVNIEEDKVGMVGMNINRDLLAVAIDTIKPNVKILSYLMLSLKEKQKYLLNYIKRNIIRSMSTKSYIPNYKNVIDHFLPHVGGKPVLDELQKTLGFSDTVMEASRMTLYRYGNTFSSSIWYELAYVEAKGRIKKGNLVWQMAFGTGFKCSSVIWRAMKTVDHNDHYNPWTDEITEYPVVLKDCEQFPVIFTPSK
ncbi:3-ketoacyl-CoA synthase 2-like [Rutidosis leptorrhynchoides]|uniref:3-ketoacyl-CoA synthase 2-like n=1 Tax=Rutidosis leptorrhynchoides TaxID=125765 RepID=UPI003A9956A2